MDVAWWLRFIHTAAPHDPTPSAALLVEGAGQHMMRPYSAACQVADRAGGTGCDFDEAVLAAVDHARVERDLGASDEGGSSRIVP
jgi:hypothetical protein